MWKITYQTHLVKEKSEWGGGGGGGGGGVDKI